MASVIPASDSNGPLSVSQLNRLAKRLLETHFDSVWIVGELSNLAQPGSGHWYFSLKDDDAQVRCAMFRTANQRLRLAPRNGQQVLVRGRVSLYEGRGEFQLIVEHMEDAGAGALQRAFEELKMQLQAEGLFAAQRKRPLPAYPRRIAIITSPTGAAVRDIVSVFKRRFPAIELGIFPVAVQGESATPAILNAFRQLQDRAGFDAVILARGGGSIEDLWAFNEEALARAIVACNIPVVSAVGHETDFTIADFVADVRAPTPSAAAEMLSPDRVELAQRLRSYQYQLQRGWQRQLQLCIQRVTAVRRLLRHPGERLREQAQRLDDYELQLQRAIQRRLRHAHQQLTLHRAQLEHAVPIPRLHRGRQQLAHLALRLSHGSRQILDQRRQQLAGLGNNLDALSPLATLRRGYAIVSDSKGVLVRSSKQLRSGDLIDTRLAQGHVRSRVESADEG